MRIARELGIPVLCVIALKAELGKINRVRVDIFQH
jgi:hypothetical protein